VRRARVQDEPAMRRITRDVWEGTDYVPMVWSRWLADPNGCVMIAELNGRPIGLQHAVLQPDGTTWLEGIRVASKERGVGVGRVLVDHGVQWAREAGSEFARMAISSDNEASNRLAIGAGFEVADTFRRFTAPAGGGGDDGVRLALPSDEDAIRPMLKQQRARLYGQGWSAYALTRERLRLLLATHSVVVTRGYDAMGIATVTPERPVLRPGLLLGSVTGMTAIARWLRRRGNRAGRGDIAAVLAVSQDTVGALGAAGYEGPCEPDVVIRELRL